MTEQDIFKYLEDLQTIVYEGTPINTQEQLFQGLLKQRGKLKNIILNHEEYAKAMFKIDKIPNSDKEINKLLDEYIESEKEKIFSTPTKFENYYTYKILNILNESINKVLNLNKIKIANKIIVGTLPIGSLNAMVKSFEDSNFILLLVDSGFFTTADLISKIIARIIVDDESISYDLNLWKKKVDDTPEIKERFIRLINSIVFAGTPTASPIDIINNPKINDVARVIRESFEFFVIAHEYSHLYLGHLDGIVSEKFALSSEKGKSAEIEIGVYEWYMELEADIYAQNLTFHYMKLRGHDYPLVKFGIELFFEMIEKVDRTICFHTGHDYKSFFSINDTHPLPQIRLDNLHIRFNIPEIPFPESNHHSFREKLIPEIMKYMWDKSMMRLVANISMDRQIDSKWLYKLNRNHLKKRKTIGFQKFDEEDWIAEFKTTPLRQVGPRKNS